MRDREKRLQIIKDLIRNERIESQEYLLEKLKDNGFVLTQATLSRDLKFLKVSKSADKNGYRYLISSAKFEDEQNEDFIRDINRGLISVTFSGNMAVIKTQIGHANSVALAIDNLEINGILGTIAGDDTIFLVLEEDFEKEHIYDYLSGKKRDLQ